MPDKIFFHIDVNSAFLSWEACRRLKSDPESPDLRTIASVVGGSEQTRHGIVLAKSTPAKKYNIQTGESLMQARKKCPGLIVVPPTFSYYVKMSSLFISLLKKYAPVVEQYSIDEAFCDMTGTQMLYGPLIQFADRLRNEINDTLGFTVNIGISSNKLLAKMASDFKKPNLTHTLFPYEIKEKMWPLPVGELFFVGKATKKRLANLGIHTIGDIALSDKQLLINNFKKHGEVIWNYANGLDVEFATNHDAANKSYSNITTIQADITDAATAKIIILSLCETVGARMRADKAYISVVSVSILTNGFNRFQRQCTLENPTNVTEIIYQNACRLFDELWDKSPVRQIGISASHATDQDYQQLDFFNQQHNEKLSRLNSAIDDIRTRFGEDSVKRARFINSEHEHMSGGLNKEKREHRIR